MEEGKYIKGTFINDTVVAIEMTCDETHLLQFVIALASKHKLVRKMMLIASSIPDKKYENLVKTISLEGKFGSTNENSLLSKVLDDFLSRIEEDKRKGYENEINNILNNDDKDN